MLDYRLERIKLELNKYSFIKFNKFRCFSAERFRQDDSLSME
jgi:hypothetical protein